MTQEVKKIKAKVTLNSLFREISFLFGFKDEDLKKYEDDIFSLMVAWETKGYVEVYFRNEDREKGRLKQSDLVNGSVPWYIDVYHARISENNDPLIVLKKDNENEDCCSFSIRFLVNHDQIFGKREEKNDKERMKQIRTLIDKYIQQGSKNE